MVSKHAWIYKLTSGIILGAAAAAWVQSQLFLWDFGRLYGQAIDWGKFEIPSIAELMVWVLSVIVTAVFVLKSTKPNLLKTLSATVILMGLGSLAISIFTNWTTLFTVESKMPSASDYKSASDAFSFHEKNNVIIIIVDAFQADVFQEIADKYPDEVSFLNGFK